MNGTGGSAKRVLILGATSAIAEACARRWAAEGARLFLVARHASRLELISADLGIRGASAVETHVMDMLDEDAHEAMLARCVGVFEGIDVALIAHGTLPDQAACERDVALALREFAVNAGSTIALLTRLASRFEAQRQGCIAVISSVAGDRGRPSNYVYGAAKGAVSLFCEGLRARLFAAGVQVMTIKPGFVDTPMTRHLALPPALLATPDSVAQSIVRGIERRTGVLYTPWFWRWIMLVIRVIPDAIFKRLKL